MMICPVCMVSKVDGVCGCKEPVMRIVSSQDAPEAGKIGVLCKRCGETYPINTGHNCPDRRDDGVALTAIPFRVPPGFEKKIVKCLKCDKVYPKEMGHDCTPPNLETMGNLRGDNRLITPELMLIDALNALKQGKLNVKPNKAIVIFLESSTDIYNNAFVVANLSRSEIVALMETVKARVLRDMGFT